MLKGLEYHGRLTRADGRPANPGTYTLKFTLHSDERTRRASWTEEVLNVTVSSGGFFSVILGLTIPMKADHFKTAPRWLSVRVIRKGEMADETGPRTPLMGTQVRLLDTLERLEKRISKLEEHKQSLLDQPSPERLAERLSKVEGRVTIVSDGDLPALMKRMERLLGRVDLLDCDDGRLDLLEDRLDDVDGSGGDIIDLNERVDALEKGAKKGAMKGETLARDLG